MCKKKRSSIVRFIYKEHKGTTFTNSWRRFIQTATKFCLFFFGFSFLYIQLTQVKTIYIKRTHKTCTQTFTCMFIVRIHTYIHSSVLKRKRERDNGKKVVSFYFFKVSFAWRRFFMTSIFIKVGEIWKEGPANRANIASLKMGISKSK